VEADNIFTELDTDNSGSISLSELTDWKESADKIISETAAAAAEQMARKVFAKYDTSPRDGTLNLSEFRAVCIEIGEAQSEKDHKALFSRLDTSGDGVLDYEEFIAWYLNGDRMDTRLGNTGSVVMRGKVAVQRTKQFILANQKNFAVSDPNAAATQMNFISHGGADSKAELKAFFATEHVDPEQKSWMEETKSILSVAVDLKTTSPAAAAHLIKMYQPWSALLKGDPDMPELKTFQPGGDILRIAQGFDGGEANTDMLSFSEIFGDEEVVAFLSQLSFTLQLGWTLEDINSQLSSFPLRDVLKFRASMTTGALTKFLENGLGDVLENSIPGFELPDAVRMMTREGVIPSEDVDLTELAAGILQASLSGLGPKPEVKTRTVTIKHKKTGHYLSVADDLRSLVATPEEKQVQVTIGNQERLRFFTDPKLHTLQSTPVFHGTKSTTLEGVAVPKLVSVRIESEVKTQDGIKAVMHFFTENGDVLTNMGGFQTQWMCDEDSRFLVVTNSEGRSTIRACIDSNPALVQTTDGKFALHYDQADVKAEPFMWTIERVPKPPTFSPFSFCREHPEMKSQVFVNPIEKEGFLTQNEDTFFLPIIPPSESEDTKHSGGVHLIQEDGDVLAYTPEKGVFNAVDEEPSPNSDDLEWEISGEEETSQSLLDLPIASLVKGIVDAVVPATIDSLSDMGDPEVPTQVASVLSMVQHASFFLKSVAAFHVRDASGRGCTVNFSDKFADVGQLATVLENIFQAISTNLQRRKEMPNSKIA
jgi:hypothetical protein